MLCDDRFTKGVFKRLKIPAKEITFDDLDAILLKMGLILPMKISILWLVLLKHLKNNLIEKLLIQKRGGLCYELNSLLYYF